MEKWKSENPGNHIDDTILQEKHMQEGRHSELMLKICRDFLEEGVLPDEQGRKQESKLVIILY